jgi:hypothetical protein
MESGVVWVRPKGHRRIAVGRHRAAERSQVCPCNFLIVPFVNCGRQFSPSARHAPPPSHPHLRQG